MYLTSLSLRWISFLFFFICLLILLCIISLFFFFFVFPEVHFLLFIFFIFHSKLCFISFWIETYTSYVGEFIFKHIRIKKKKNICASLKYKEVLFSLFLLMLLVFFFFHLFFTCLLFKISVYVYVFAYIYTIHVQF